MIAIYYIIIQSYINHVLCFVLHACHLSRLSIYIIHLFSHNRYCVGCSLFIGLCSVIVSQHCSYSYHQNELLVQGIDGLNLIYCYIVSLMLGQADTILYDLIHVDPHPGYLQLMRQPFPMMARGDLTVHTPLMGILLQQYRSVKILFRILSFIIWIACVM